MSLGACPLKFWPVAQGGYGEVEVAAAWAEVRVGVRKSESMKSKYMILEVAAALVEAMVGVNKSDSTKTVYMSLD